MVNKYKNHSEIVELELGDYCTAKVPKNDTPQRRYDDAYPCASPPTSQIHIRALDQARHPPVEIRGSKTLTTSTSVQLRRMTKSGGQPAQDHAQIRC
jgi:hypothetical protein